jgi:phosphoribosylformylglycinamidine synthase
MTTDLKKSGDSVLVLVGQLDDGMGGSTYYDIAGGSSNDVPMVDLGSMPDVLTGVHQQIAAGNVLACHDVSEGGVMTTISEMCFGGSGGARVQLPWGVDPEAFLFSETAGCFVVEVDADNDIETMFNDLPHTVVGFTTPERAITVSQQQELFTAPVTQLKRAWQGTLKEAFHG